jgi:hypothetical protein
VSVLEAMTHHRELTLLGKPGSGKSTFGARVLLALAQGWQGQAEAMAVLGEGWQGAALLPVRIVLRHFAERLPAGDQPVRAGICGSSSVAISKSAAMVLPALLAGAAVRDRTRCASQESSHSGHLGTSGGLAGSRNAGAPERRRTAGKRSRVRWRIACSARGRTLRS